MDKRYGDATCIGLISFATSACLIGLTSCGFYTTNATTFGTVFFFTGIAQVTAGIMASHRGDLFGSTVTCSFGFFFLSYGGLAMTPYMGWVGGPSKAFLGWYLLMWAIVLWGLVVSSLSGKHPYAVTILLVIIAVLLSLDAIEHWHENENLEKFCGYLNLVISACGFYLGAAALINHEYNALILPIGLTPYLKAALVAQMAALAAQRKRIHDHEPTSDDLEKPVALTAAEPDSL